MMTFQQACSYVRATGASAYCYTPWVRDGEWIGLQHCMLYERTCAADASPLGMRLRRVARGAREGEVIEIERIDTWDALASPALEAEYGVDPRCYRYAACESEPDDGVLQALGAGAEVPPSLPVPVVQHNVLAGGHI